MGNTENLKELKVKDVERIRERSAISVFKDNLSYGAILERAYIIPKYHLRKQDVYITGISRIYRDFKNKNVIFVGEAGAGKTAAFLRLYTASESQGDCFDTDFFYCFAPDLLGSKKSLNDYQRVLRNIIEAGTGLEGVLLLDGLEEAFLANSVEASDRLRKLIESELTVWVSCRTSFYDRLNDAITSQFSEIIELQSWKNGDFENFISLCTKDNNNREMIENRINRIKPQVQSLLYRPLFATMILFVAENDDLDEIDNEYELISLFLDKWLERERKDKKAKQKNGRTRYDKIRDVALSVYLKTKERPKYDKSLSAFRDLLVMSNANRGTIHGFYHREFLVFFIANAIIDASLYHPDRIVKWLSQTFYDDITNIIKPVLSKLTRENSIKIYKNLFNVYKRTYEQTTTITEEFHRLKFEPEDAFLKLRDEVLYFIFRLSHINHENFALYAYNHYIDDNSKDTILFLGIAYGMAGINPSNHYTLQFANKLKPGSREDIRNRGWAMCFFGDVEEDGYKYIDSERKPWVKIRENRLNRLIDNETKHVTRVLDLPLLYCFYSSRDFSDCTSYREYRIIKNTNISLPCFGDEQKAFMKNQKMKLVDVYLRHLLNEEINNKGCNIEQLLQGGVMVNNGPGKICIEVDEELADKILKQAEYRENVQNNLRSFWNKNGENIINQYKDQLRAPEHHNINESVFEQKLRECQVLIMSANTVEGTILTRRLIEVSDVDGLDALPFEGHLFQFARVEGVPICHIWPSDTSSFTRYGSFSALEAALEIATPQYVMSVGVAFGIDPIKQSLGDVLISKDLIFYDHFNKVTNGQVKLNPHEVYRIEANLTAQLHQLESATPPKEVGSFSWFFGTILTGGTVLSDAEERNKILNAAINIGYSINGGEMEASGIFYACKKRKNRNIPFIVIKGICDWGAEKNAWEEVIDGQNNGDTVKDCVQAFACDNAFSTMRYILKNLNFNHATMMTEDISEDLVNRNRAQERADNANEGLIAKDEKTKADSSIDQISSVDGRYCKVYEIRKNEYQADERSGSSFAIHQVYSDWITIHINYGDGESNTISDFRVGNQEIVGKHRDYVLTLHSIDTYSKCKVEIRKKDW